VNDAPSLKEDGVVIVYLQYLKSFSPTPLSLNYLFSNFSFVLEVTKREWDIKKGENEKEWIV
jgi:hypothetical protein